MYPTLKSQCILFNTKEKYEKIGNMEVVEELKYLGVIVQAKRNVFEGEKNEMLKKKNQKIVSDDKLFHRKKLPSSNDVGKILERSGATKRSVTSIWSSWK